MLGTTMVDAIAEGCDEDAELRPPVIPGKLATMGHVLASPSD